MATKNASQDGLLDNLQGVMVHFCSAPKTRSQGVEAPPKGNFRRYQPKIVLVNHVDPVQQVAADGMRTHLKQGRPRATDVYVVVDAFAGKLIVEVLIPEGE